MTKVGNKTAGNVAIVVIRFVNIAIRQNTNRVQSAASKRAASPKMIHHKKLILGEACVQPAAQHGVQPMFTRATFNNRSGCLAF
jgi:hypothetical protein